MIVISDNGASGEGGPDGSVNEMKFANGIPDSMEANLALLDELGGPRPTTTIPTAGRWRSTRRSRCGSATSSTAAPSDPCIISWPKGINAGGEIRDQYHHAIDLVPTILDVVGVEPPETIGGHVQSRLRWRQHALQLRCGLDPERPTDAVLRDARLPGDLARRLEGRHDASDAEWLESLRPGHVGALPHRRRPLRATRSGGRGARTAAGADQPLVRRGRRQRGVPARRSLGAGDHLHPASAADPAARTATSTTPASPRSRSPRPSTSATAPTRSGPWSTSRSRGRRSAVRPRIAIRRPRALRQGQPAALRLQLLSAASSRRSCDARCPSATRSLLSAAFEKDGEDPPGVATGMLSLFHGENQVGEGRIKTQPGKFMLAGEGLCVGRDSGDPVTDDYAGSSTRTRSPAARSIASRSTSAASRTSTWSARPRR